LGVGYPKEFEMSVEITHVHYGNTSKTHESIDAYQYHSDGQTKLWYRWKASMVSFLESEETAHVKGVAVGIVDDPPKAKYLRTHANGYYNDNLLSLPTFQP
jgi:hypothetical protein